MNSKQTGQDGGETAPMPLNLDGGYYEKPGESDTRSVAEARRAFCYYLREGAPHIIDELRDVALPIYAEEMDRPGRGMEIWEWEELSHFLSYHTPIFSANGEPDCHDWDRMARYLELFEDEHSDFSAAPPHIRLAHAVDQWAGKYDFDAAWFEECALWYLSACHSGTSDLMPFDYVGGFHELPPDFERGAISHRVIKSQLDGRVICLGDGPPPVTATYREHHPHLESRKSWMDAWMEECRLIGEKHCEEQEAAFVKAGYVPARGKRKPERIEWLVRRHVFGHSVEKIAQDVGQKEPTVKSALAEIRALLGFHVSPGRPEGRVDGSGARHNVVRRSGAERGVPRK